MNRLSITLGACLVVLSLNVSAQERSIDYREDVVYGKGGDDDLRLDIAIPEDLDGPAPCVVVIHGGAWRGGNKRQHKNEILAFAKQGYVSVTVQYRLCPKHPFPAQVEDVKCAVRYLRAHAKDLGIDSQRFGAIGFSAGAHLAMMLGTMDQADGLEGQGGWQDQSSKVQAVVAFFGPTKLDADDIPEISIPLVDAFIGGSKEEMPEAFRKASPITYVSQGDAPMLLFQGTEDVLIPYSQAFEMVTAMTKADVPGRVELLINAGHGWGGEDLSGTIEASNAFFRRHLRRAGK